MMLVEQLKDDLKKRKRAFWDWHNANPQVYEKFEDNHTTRVCHAHTSDVPTDAQRQPCGLS